MSARWGWAGWGLSIALACSACFSKPSFTPRDGDVAADDAPVDSPIDTPIVPPGGPARLATGLKHTCRIDAATNLICWGDAARGQLGERSLGGAPWTGTPGPAFPARIGWTAVAAGEEHTCGIQEGGVYCWGRNSSGESDPTLSASTIAITQIVMPPGAGTPEKIYAGDVMTCVIKTTGDTYCWGRIDYSAGAPNRQLPTRLTATTTFTELAIADDHACAIATDGAAYCWGSNGQLQLGRAGGEVAFASAAPISTAATFTAIAAAHESTCAITTDADLVCWGTANRGHLMQAGAASEFQPIDAQRTWTHVAVGLSHVCAVGDGSVHCYGDNYVGALGRGRFRGDRESLGAALAIGFPVAVLVAYDAHNCVLGTDGEMTKCWGTNTKGELGNGEFTRKVDPTRVMLPVGIAVQELIAGDDHMCARTGTGPFTTYCWGLNDFKQVTNSANVTEPVPVTATSTSFVQLAAGNAHTCGRILDGGIECWGTNEAKQLGSDAVTSTNTKDAPLGSASGWTQVAAGSTATCAIADGELHCWGLVPGTGTTQSSPQMYGTYNGWPWHSISIGSDFAVGVVLDSGVPHLVSFGRRCAAGIPAGSPDPQPAPGEIFAGLVFSTIPRVAAAQHAGNHTCVHRMNGSTPIVTCFGQNLSGQLGGTAACGQSIDVLTSPATTWNAPVETLATVHAASDHSCALDSANRLKCWGLNSNFELGMGGGATATFANSGTWTAVVGGHDHTCAISTDGNVYCWGENQFGQVGDGTQYRPSPVVAGVVP